MQLSSAIYEPLLRHRSPLRCYIGSEKDINVAVDSYSITNNLSLSDYTYDCKSGSYICIITHFIIKLRHRQLLSQLHACFIVYL